jgi:hypothetical protein
MAMKQPKFPFRGLPNYTKIAISSTDVMIFKYFCRKFSEKIGVFDSKQS